jgi:cellulose synthase (UDP-forming)
MLLIGRNFNGLNAMAKSSEKAMASSIASDEPLKVTQRLLLLIYLAVAVAYLSWRPGSFNPDAPIFSALVYGAELFGFVCALLFLYMCRRLNRRTPLPVPEGMTADVFVPTINESVDILRRTIMAAMRMDLVGEVWLLDDGNREEMRALAEQLGCRYVARSDNTHAKAGNINHALKLCEAPYIALFDADHAPAKRFLKQTLGFFVDPTVAFVQTPHDFYNLDSFQNRVDKGRARVWSEQLLFFRVIQAGKDRLNSAFFCGSCAVIRREALESIGGIATGTVTEDIHTSLRLHKHRWRSVYYGESLAYGLAPSTATAFLNQRLRWGQGAMQTWRREGLITAKGLSWPQRLSYLATMFAYFEGWQRLILFFAPVIVLMAGVMPIAAVDAEFLVRFVPYFILNYWVFEEVGRGYGRTILTEQYTMTRFATFIASTFAYFLRRLKFVVTPKTMGERAAVGRTLWPQLLVLTLNIVAIPTAIWLQTQGSHLPEGALVANVIWAAMTATIAAIAVRHALRVAKYRRREYRFPVPLPFRMATDQGESLVLVTDVSPAGCRLSGLPLQEQQIGDVIRGSLILPSGEFKVQATVRSRLRAADSDADAAEVGMVGCEFVWNSPVDQAELELFLYGSDLQWQFNGFTERVPTPLEKLGNLFSKQTRLPAVSTAGWAPVLYPNPRTAAGAGVAYLSPPDADGARRLVSRDTFPVGAKVTAEVVTAEGPRNIEGRLLNDDMLMLPISSMHIYRWTT